MAAPIAGHAENISAHILSVLKSNDDEVPQRRTRTLSIVVQSSSELSSFHQEGASVSELASYINKCLTVSSTRLVGMALLEPLVEQMTPQLFQQHCLSWLRLLTQIVQPYSSTAHLRLAVALVTKVLSKASRHPDVSRDVAGSLIHPLVENALQLKDEKLLYSLEVLVGCMRYFPGPCGPLRNRLFGHVTSILGNEQDSKTVELTCRCFALLPSLGGGGSGGVLHQEAWTYYMRKLVSSVSQVLSELYSDCKPGLSAPSEEDHTMPLPEVPLEEPERTFTLAEQIQRLLAAMTQLLRNNFPVTVIIPHKDIITVVCDLLAVNGRTLALKGSLQASHLLMVISNIHSSAVQLLTSLIERCGSHLLGYLRTINQLVLQTLNWTAALDDTDTSKFRMLRSEVYRSYGTLLTTVGASAYAGENVEKIVSQAIRDAHLQENTTQQDSHKLDQAGTNDLGQPRKKKQKKYHQWRVQPVGGWGSKQEGDQHMEQLCTDALRALRKLFFACGSRMKWTLHRSIHLYVIKALLKCQGNLSLASAAYQSSVCRKELYHVLMACLLAPSPQWSAPLQSSIHVFSQGRLDPDVQVKQFCVESAAVLENIAHPRSPQISCPLLPPSEDRTEGASGICSAIFPGLKVTPSWERAALRTGPADNRLKQTEQSGNERDKRNAESSVQMDVDQLQNESSGGHKEDITEQGVDGSGEVASEGGQMGERKSGRGHGDEEGEGRGEGEDEDDSEDEDGEGSVVLVDEEDEGDDDGKAESGGCEEERLGMDGPVKNTGTAKSDSSGDGQGVTMEEGQHGIRLERGEGASRGDGDDHSGLEQRQEGSTPTADDDESEEQTGEPSVAEMLATFSSQGPDTGD